VRQAEIGQVPSFIVAAGKVRLRISKRSFAPTITNDRNGIHWAFSYCSFLFSIFVFPLD